MNFGEKVKEARILKNLSQTELAAITGISERSLYTYEHLNTLPRKSNLKKLSEALNVSISYLADDEETDVHKNIENAEFIDQVKNKLGNNNKGLKEVQDVLAHAGALFAGSDLDDTAKELFMQTLIQLYISSKKIREILQKE